jgi:hypothetical protein
MMLTSSSSSSSMFLVTMVLTKWLQQRVSVMMLLNALLLRQHTLQAAPLHHGHLQ